MSALRRTPQGPLVHHRPRGSPAHPRPSRASARAPGHRSRETAAADAAVRVKPPQLDAAPGSGSGLPAPTLESLPDPRPLHRPPTIAPPCRHDPPAPPGTPNAAVNAACSSCPVGQTSSRTLRALRRRRRSANRIAAVRRTVWSTDRSPGCWPSPRSDAPPPTSRRQSRRKPGARRSPAAHLRPRQRRRGLAASGSACLRSASSRRAGRPMCPRHPSSFANAPARSSMGRRDPSSRPSVPTTPTQRPSAAESRCALQYRMTGSLQYRMTGRKSPPPSSRCLSTERPCGPTARNFQEPSGSARSTSSGRVNLRCTE